MASSTLEEMFYLLDFQAKSDEGLCVCVCVCVFVVGMFLKEGCHTQCLGSHTPSSNTPNSLSLSISLSFSLSFSSNVTL